jgi:hypothetical protein
MMTIKERAWKRKNKKGTQNRRQKIKKQRNVKRRGKNDENKS